MDAKNQFFLQLSRKPRENLKADGIWTQRATFFTKIGVPLGAFLQFFWKLILKQKHRFGATKHEIWVPNSLYKDIDPRTCTAWRNFAEFWPTNWCKSGRVGTYPSRASLQDDVSMPKDKLPQTIKTVNFISDTYLVLPWSPQPHL